MMTSGQGTMGSALGAGRRALSEEAPLGYKWTEAGVIPQDWQVSTVGTEFRVQLGKMLDAAKNAGVPKPYIGNRSVQWGQIDVCDIDTVPMTSADLQRFRLRQGDLLVCEGGEIGRAAIWDEPIPECYYQKALHRLRPTRSYDRYLIMSLLQLWASTGYLANYVTQTSIAHLPKDKLEIVPLPVPPPDEQHAIAEALSDVDGLLGALEKLIAKKQAIKQAVMQQLLTGNIRLPGFVGAWETISLGELERRGDIRLFRGKVISQQDIDRLPGDYPIYSSSVHFNGLFGSYGDYMFDEELITWSVDGGGHFFHRPKHRFSVTNVCGYLRIRTSSIDYRYLVYHLQNLHSQMVFDYTVKAHPSVIRGAYRVALPQPSEQRAIAAVLSDMDAEITALERRRDKTRAIKQGMMQQLLTGQVRLVKPE